MADVRITSIDQVQMGLFVKWVNHDKTGRFYYTGEVTKVFVDKPKAKKEGDAGSKRKDKPVTNSFFEMLTMDGTIGIQIGGDIEEDHELFLTTVKPAGWAKFKKNPKQFTETKIENAKIVPAKPKKQQVFDLVAAHPKKSEAALLKLAKKEIGGSEVQLNNYIKIGLLKH